MSKESFITEKQVCIPKFISQYGVKKLGANEFNSKMDTTDQRAPITSVEELWNTYMSAEDVEDELEDETIDDFDDDIYEYDDISEVGEDILTAAQPEIAAAGRRLAKSKKSKRTM